MIQDQLERKLIAAARLQEPNERVPAGFERRILAVLLAKVPVDPWSVWNRFLWRAAAWGIAITVVSGIWTFYHDPHTSLEPVDLEYAVLVAVDHSGDIW